MTVNNETNKSCRNCAHYSPEMPTGKWSCDYVKEIEEYCKLMLFDKHAPKDNK